MARKQKLQKMIGYARVSSKDQNLDSQIDLLKEAGCSKIFKDKTAQKICDTIGIGRRTLFYNLAKAKPYKLFTISYS